MDYENIVVPGARPQVLPAGMCTITVSEGLLRYGYRPLMYESSGNEVIVRKDSTISHDAMYDVGNGNTVVTTELRYDVWCWATENLDSVHEHEISLGLIIRFSNDEDAVAFMLKYG